MSAKHLTTKLRQALSIDQLMSLICEHSDTINAIHCSAAWSYLASKHAGECRIPGGTAGT
jgi:hypothetical protein